MIDQERPDLGFEKLKLLRVSTLGGRDPKTIRDEPRKAVPESLRMSG